jgi:uncharacterized protein YbjQ (UPF0145 family)
MERRDARSREPQAVSLRTAARFTIQEETMNGRVEMGMVTTANDLPGYRVVRNFGIVRGIVVRSRSIVGNFAAALQTVVGGNITILTNLCEKTREDAFELMLQHAAQHGANAVVGMRYDATEVMQGVTEVLAYGTAVQVERAS